MDKVTRQWPQTTTFFKRRRAEAVSNRGPSAYQPNALPLGQTGSLATTDHSPSFDWHTSFSQSISTGAQTRLLRQTYGDVQVPLSWKQSKYQCCFRKQWPRYLGLCSSNFMLTDLNSYLDFRTLSSKREFEQTLCCLLLKWLKLIGLRSKHIKGSKERLFIEHKHTICLDLVLEH